MTILEGINPEVLFTPQAEQLVGRAESRFAGKIRLFYKNNLVLTLPYFFKVHSLKRPDLLHYDEELHEDAPVYKKIKGNYYYFYLNDFGWPMFQEKFLSIEEDVVSSDVNLPHSWYKAYKHHTFVLSFLDNKSLHYAFYKEGYKRMEQIVQNIENDLPYYQNISDINLEIADIFAYQKLPILYAQSKFILDKQVTLRYPEMEKLPYGINFEEWKNILLQFFGEQNVFGFKGMGENYFKDLTYRTELLFFTFWLHNEIYTIDYTRVSEEDRKYYIYFFFDKINLANYSFSKGCPWNVGSRLTYVWVSFMRRLFWRRLKVIAKF